MNQVTINNLTVYDPPASYRGPAVNTMSVCTGAQRFGVGSFLMDRADYSKLSDTATLKITVDEDPAQGLQMTVRIGGAVPFSVGIEGTDLVEVIVFDGRSDAVSPVSGGYNVQRQGFTYTGSNPDFYPSTMLLGTPWTWSGVLGVLGVAVPAGLPTWKPRNLIYDNVPFARVLDDIASRLFYVVGYDWAAESFALFVPGSGMTSNGQLLEKIGSEIIEGGDGDRQFRRLPATYRVVFKAFDTDNPDDPYANRAYTKDIATGTGRPGLVEALHLGEYVAVYASGAWKEQANLDSVAADIASRAIRAKKVPVQEATYRGIWPFKPDGAIRGVRWICDHRGARTTLRYGNDQDFTAIDEARRAIRLQTNTLVAGMGSTNASVSQSGTRYLWGTTTGLGMRFGAATASWDGSNIVTVTPCVSEEDETATGDPDVDCYIESDYRTIPSTQIKEGDILAYWPIYTESGVGGLLMPTPARLGIMDCADTVLNLDHCVRELKFDNPFTVSVNVDGERATIGIDLHDGYKLDMVPMTPCNGIKYDWLGFDMSACAGSSTTVTKIAWGQEFVVSYSGNGGTGQAAAVSLPLESDCTSLVITPRSCNGYLLHLSGYNSTEKEYGKPYIDSGQIMIEVWTRSYVCGVYQGRVAADPELVVDLKLCGS